MKNFLFFVLLAAIPVFAAESSKTAEVLKDCEARADVIGAHPITLKHGSKFPVLEEKIGYLIIGVGADRIRVATNQVRVSSMSEREKAELPNKENGSQRRNIDASPAIEALPSNTPSTEHSQTTNTIDTPANSRESQSATETGIPDLENAPPLRLAPQENWWKRTGQEMTSCEELYKGLLSSTKSDSSLEVTECPEIYKGVRLMMPLLEALSILHLGTKMSMDESPASQATTKVLATPISCLIPPKSPISHAGIPFFFRPFDLKKIPEQMRPTDGQNEFNLLYIITDAADRVVGLLFVCETPRSMESPNTEFITYNFVLNRKKAVRFLKVKYELHALNQSKLLTVDTWLIDENRGKCLEVVQWYLPVKIGNFIRHVLEIKLGLAPSIPPPK